MPDLTTQLSVFLASLYAGTATSAAWAGGGGTTSTLTLKPTTGVGTTGADIIFGVGNNGATEVARFTTLNNTLTMPATTTIQWGTNPAGGTSLIGVPNNTNFLAARNNANNAAVQLAFLDTADVWQMGGTASVFAGTVKSTQFIVGATPGVVTFGPAAVASITVKGGIVTAIS